VDHYRAAGWITTRAPLKREAALRAITDGTQTLDAFLTRVGAHIEQLVAEGRALGRIAVPPAPQPIRRDSPRTPNGADARTPNPGRQRRS
jgi:hypothetical protein